MRAEDEGFDCRSAGRRNVRSIRRGRRMATVHRTVAFRWVRIPHDWIKKSGYPKGYPDFLAEDEGFEPPQTESESGVLPLHKSPMDALHQNASIIIQICAHLSSVNFKKCGKNKHSHFCLPEQKKPARARTARNARRRENEEREKRLFLLSPARSDARRNRPY